MESPISGTSGWHREYIDKRSPLLHTKLLYVRICSLIEYNAMEKIGVISRQNTPSHAIVVDLNQ